MVHAVKIRPIPPEIKASYFKIYDQVNVNDKDGWRVGRIINRDPTGSKRTGEDRLIYSVYFSSSGEEVAYQKWKFRVHQELINGKWVCTTKFCRKNYSY
ncbi:hypothetical protein MKX01_026974 [Papaver californicum]|nr:hypothetical protein MKX01_026974 [Papaver californicum]